MRRLLAWFPILPLAAGCYTTGERGSGPPDAGPTCSAFPDILGDGPAIDPHCYEASFCGAEWPLPIPEADFVDVSGDLFVPVAVESTDAGLLVHGLVLFYGRFGPGGRLDERAARVAYRIGFGRTRPVSTVERVETADAAEFVAAWPVEFARPSTAGPPFCAPLGDWDVWLSARDNFATAWPSPIWVGVAVSRTTGSAWTVELPPVPIDCRGEAAGCSFGFLHEDGSGTGVAYGRPFSDQLATPRIYCAVEPDVCQALAGELVGCAPVSFGPSTRTCAEWAWIRSVCDARSFDDLPVSDEAVCDGMRW